MAEKSRDSNSRQLEALVLGKISRESRDALFATCQQELRAAAGNLMRHERPDHILQPTALVSEVYLRLFDASAVPIDGKAHFVNLAVRSMRQILVEYARRRETSKRGGGWQPTTLSGLEVEEVQNHVEVLDLNDAITKLADLDARASRIVDLRIFGGLTMDEIAAVIGVTRRTVQRDWKFAVLWLRQEFADRKSQ